MAYEYVKEFYGLEFAPKMRVQHVVTGKFGEVRKQGNCAPHYVSVRFDGLTHNRPCHPQELVATTPPDAGKEG